MDGGEPFELRQLASAPTPTLLWFWAPWCDVCNAEAPAIERMAASAGERLAVVAIGGRDDAAKPDLPSSSDTTSGPRRCSSTNR